MPQYRRRYHNNRGDRGNDQQANEPRPPRPENQAPQGNNPPSGNPPAQRNSNRQGNRPQRRRSSPQGNTPPKENNSSQPRPQHSRRPPQRKAYPPENAFPKEKEISPSQPKPQPNRPSQRRPQQQGNKPSQGNNFSPRRNSSARGNASSRGSASTRGRPVSTYHSFIDRPAPSVPIRTNKGIRARSQRGQFSQHWWARRWIEAMEGLVDSARLQRGRSYARSGQVLSINEMQNGIEAKVQGSRPQPYKVTIQVTPLTDAQWDQVIDALAEQALFTAQLLAGEMPGNIEDAFHTAWVSLFPDKTGDLNTDCSCPDWANPCKHVAATHYILGDRFDDDPFLLFRMRGRSQEQILQALRQRRAVTGEPEADSSTDLESSQVVEAEQVTPLEETLDHFWEPVESLDTFPLTIKPASVDMPLLKRLGEPAFLGGESLEELLKPVYDVFVRSSLRAAYSEEEPVESSNGNGNGNGNGQEDANPGDAV